MQNNNKTHNSYIKEVFDSLDQAFFTGLVEMLAFAFSIQPKAVINWFITRSVTGLTTRKKIYNYVDNCLASFYSPFVHHYSTGQVGPESTSEILHIMSPEALLFLTFFRGTGPGISNLTIRNSVEGLDIFALAGFKVKSIIIDSGIATLPDCFCRCCLKLKSVSLPEGLKVIQTGAFQGCINLVNINIPDSVTCIERNAFANCKSLPPEIKEKIRAIGGKEALGEGDNPSNDN